MLKREKRPFLSLSIGKLFCKRLHEPHIPTHNKRTPTRLVGVLTAEDRGFEPLRDCSQHAFQACDIGR